MSGCGLTHSRSMANRRASREFVTGLLAYWPRHSLSALVAKPRVTGQMRAQLHVQRHCNNPSIPGNE